MTLQTLQTGDNGVADRAGFSILSRSRLPSSSISLHAASLRAAKKKHPPVRQPQAAAFSFAAFLSSFSFVRRN
jgi:hypothetical protein